MPYNQKSDVWSLGCILYEMVTLRHAFDSNSMKGLVLKILRGTYPEIPSHYSQDLKDLISEMLIKDPARRPSIRKVVEKPFLASRISTLLSNTITKHEFIQDEDDDGKSTKKSSKKALKKKFPAPDSALGRRSEEEKSDASMMEGKEKLLGVKDSEKKNQGFKNYLQYKKSQKSSKMDNYEDSKNSSDEHKGKVS